jgi:hypothetical protein
MPAILSHLLKYHKDMGMGIDDYPSHSEIWGLMSSDLLPLLTDQFKMDETHDIGKIKESVIQAESECPEHAPFFRAMLHHGGYDEKSHNSLFFRASVYLISRVLGICMGGEHDGNMIEEASHNILEWNMLHPIKSRYPKLVDVAHKAIINYDVDGPLEVVCEFYGKNSRRVKEQLSVIKSVGPEFFTDITYFARTLVGNFKRNGNLGDEEVNRFFEYMAGMNEDDYKRMGDFFDGLNGYLRFGPGFYDFMMMPHLPGMKDSANILKSEKYRV